MLNSGASAFQLGLLTVAQSIPALLLGLFVGVRVDRRRRRPLLILADLARATALASIPLAATLGARGARGVIRAHAAEVRDVPIAGDPPTDDLDTQGEYDLLLARYATLRGQP